MTRFHTVHPGRAWQSVADVDVLIKKIATVQMD